MGDVVDRVRRDMGPARDDWQREGHVHLAAMLEDLLTQAAAADEHGAGVAHVVVKPALVDGYADWLRDWIDEAWQQAQKTLPDNTGGTPVPQKLLANADVLAADHAQAARSEVQRALLRGDSLQTVGSRYADLMTHRLGIDLVSGMGQEVAAAASA